MSVTVSTSSATSASCIRYLKSFFKSEQVWFPDSAAASHMTPEDGKLLCKSPYSGSSQVLFGNGTLLPISLFGMIF